MYPTALSTITQRVSGKRGNTAECSRSEREAAVSRMMFVVAAAIIPPAPIVRWRVGLTNALMSPPPEWKWIGMWCSEHASQSTSHA